MRFVFTNLFFLLSGCASVQPVMDYQPDARLAPQPLRIAVRFAPPKPDRRCGLSPQDAPFAAQSFRDAFASALEEKGPFSVDPVQPQAQLLLDLSHVSTGCGGLLGWSIFPSIVPLLGLPYLFGVPFLEKELVVAVKATMTTPKGQPIFQTHVRASCETYTGLYYNRTLDLGCPARKVGEALRARLAEQSDTIIALQRAHTEPSLTAEFPEVVAIFELEDRGEQLTPRMSSQLTDYLEGRISRELGFRIVPHSQIRARVTEMKAESFKDCYDAHCQIELGKALAANKAIGTRVLKVGSRCLVMSTLYDLRTETIERAVESEGSCQDEGLLRSVRQVVAQLTPRKKR